MIDRDEKLTYYYKNMVNWDKRLKKEGSFIKKVLGDAGARSVLDCGCGAGRHVIYLRQAGFAADGADTNPRQIETARLEAESRSVKARFIVEDMTLLSGVRPGEYDAIMNVGNSMSSLGREAALAALKNFYRVLPPGGVALVHVLNYDSFNRKDRTETRWAKVEGVETVFLKTFHFEADHLTMLVNLMERTDDGGWKVNLNTTDMFFLNREFFRDASKQAGFDRVEFYGGLDGSRFDREKSRDQVAVFYR